MNWFTRLCRNTGLMIHHIAHPADGATPDERGGGRTQQVSRRVEEKKVSEQVTLRRTTIEEIEYRPVDDDPASRRDERSPEP